MERSPNAIFTEVQFVREHVLAKLLFPAGVFIIGYFLWAAYVQLVRGEPFGDQPMGDRALAVTGLLYILLGVFFIYVFLHSRLITEVLPDGVAYRFIPFHRRFKRIYMSDVDKYWARDYKPVREYGGWGMRVGLGGVGRAYNVSGSRGVQFVFKDGKRLLIGSQRADQMVSAIDSIAR